jgi:hypothetical protein
MKAVCTWGDGPAVLLCLEGDTLVLHEDPEKKGWVHGTVKQGSIDLTKEEARNLAFELLNAAAESDRLDKICEDHDKMVEEYDKTHTKDV